MKSLTTNDLHYVVRRLPKDIIELLRKHKLFVAGGFIRETVAGNEPKDIDLFGPEAETLKLIGKDLAEHRGGRAHFSDNAVTVICPPRMPVQLITRWCFEDAEPLVASFDFTVCQAAIWFDKTTGIFMSAIAEDFYADLAARRLVYTAPVRQEEAGGSMLRVIKFVQRGYCIQANSLGSVIARLAGQVDWGRTGGDHLTAAKVISGLLREVDPLLVVDGLEPINEHEPA